MSSKKFYQLPTMCSALRHYMFCFVFVYSNLHMQNVNCNMRYDHGIIRWSHNLEEKKIESNNNKIINNLLVHAGMINLWKWKEKKKTKKIHKPFWNRRTSHRIWFYVIHSICWWRTNKIIVWGRAYFIFLHSFSWFEFIHSLFFFFELLPSHFHINLI